MIAYQQNVYYDSLITKIIIFSLSNFQEFYWRLDNIAIICSLFSDSWLKNYTSTIQEFFYQLGEVGVS